MSKRKGGQSELRPSRYGNTTNAEIRNPRIRHLTGNRMPVDFRQESESLFQPLDESVVASQSGRYDLPAIGAFGNTLPTHPVGEPQVSTRHIPASHHLEGEHSVSAPAPLGDDATMESVMDRLGVDEATRNAIQASEEGQDGGVDTYAPPDEDEEDEELAGIFEKMGVSDDYHKYFEDRDDDGRESRRGKGMDSDSDDDDIDWDNIKWGSFTKQFNRYNKQHKGNKMGDLEDFAKMILNSTDKFNSKTLKRARFYINVILKKKK